MAQFKVDDFLIELGFNSQRVLKGLEKAEKQTMQVASRIEKRLNKAFKEMSIKLFPRLSSVLKTLKRLRLKRKLRIL